VLATFFWSAQLAISVVKAAVYDATLSADNGMAVTNGVAAADLFLVSHLVFEADLVVVGTPPLRTNLQTSPAVS
jgi:hypothetical protein